MIRLLENTSSAADLRSVMGMNNATKFKNNYLNPLIELGVVEMTQPESPNSPTQRYRLTEAGRGLLKGVVPG